MNPLVSLDVAKVDWLVDHDADDERIERILKSASEICLRYLNLPLDTYDDSDGEVIEDSDGQPDVEFSLRAAILLLGGMMYRDPTGKDPAGWSQGYLPTPVVSLLYPMRDPALA